VQLEGGVRLMGDEGGKVGERRREKGEGEKK